MTEPSPPPTTDPAVDAGPAPVETLFAKGGRLWRKLKHITVAILLLFFVWVAFQVTWLVQTAAGVHVALGWATGIAILVALGWICRPLVQAWRMPRVVCPPPMPQNGSLQREHLAKEYRYLDRYLKNLSDNPELDGHTEGLTAAREELAGMQRNLTGRAVDAASQELSAWTKARVEPLLKTLDDKADRLIYGESLKVGLGTAVSPYGTLDAFVVLWRSFHMVGRLSVLYYGRPGVLGSLLVMRDVAVATAAAAYLQTVSDSLGGVVARSIGGIAGVVAGPATQGVTNGLVMMRIGFLTRQRCRSFRRWDPSAQKSALRTALDQTRKFAAKLTTEILGPVSSKIGQAAGATARGVSTAFETAREAGQKIAAGLRSLGNQGTKDPAEAGPGASASP